MFLSRSPIDDMIHIFGETRLMELTKSLTVEAMTGMLNRELKLSLERSKDEKLRERGLKVQDFLHQEIDGEWKTMIN